MGMPVFSPGPTTIGALPHARSAISSYAAVSRGTTEEMMTCSMSVHMAVAASNARS
jgi:hypothetical protein